jgi:dTDP-4-amino-4,6-dideoxygalactose transaminase
VHGPDLDHLRRLLGEIFPERNVILCGSGTFALELALRGCNLQPGDEVVVPTFCCSTIMLPILKLGAVPVFADCGEELNMTPESINPVLTRRTRAIIVAHLFGNPAEIRPILDLVHDRNIRVIDDAAQAFGADIDSQFAGNFGAAGILSFGVEKVLSGVAGGALLASKDSSAVDEIQFPRATAGDAVRSFFSTLLRRRWRRLTGPVRDLLPRLSGSDPELPPPPYRQEQMANLHAAVVSGVLERWKPIVAARRVRVNAYDALLRSEERLQLISHQSGSACLSQVIRILPQNEREDLAARVIEVFGTAGYEIQGSYIPIHLLTPFREFARRRLRYVEAVWPDLIELPCDPDVNLTEIERIAAILKQVISSGRASSGHIVAPASRCDA